ncbi:MAG: hypothetical protein WAZ33_03720 [Lactococcus raffinolactis]
MIEILNVVASVAGVVGFLISLFNANNVRKFRKQLIEYMDNDFDLSKVEELLENILLFTASLVDDKRFDEKMYLSIFSNIDKYSKFDKKIKKSVKDLKKYDKKFKSKGTKENIEDLSINYISNRIDFCLVLKELSVDLQRISQNKYRELARRK